MRTPTRVRISKKIKHSPEEIEKITKNNTHTNAYNTGRVRKESTRCQRKRTLLILMICPGRLDCLSLTERVSGVLFQRVNYFDFQIRKRFHRIRWVPAILHRTIEAALFSSHPQAAHGRAIVMGVPPPLSFLSVSCWFRIIDFDKE